MFRVTIWRVSFKVRNTHLINGCHDLLILCPAVLPSFRKSSVSWRNDPGETRWIVVLRMNSAFSCNRILHETKNELIWLFNNSSNNSYASLTLKTVAQRHTRDCKNICCRWNFPRCTGFHFSSTRLSLTSARCEGDSPLAYKVFRGKQRSRAGHKKSNDQWSCCIAPLYILLYGPCLFWTHHIPWVHPTLLQTLYKL